MLHRFRHLMAPEDGTGAGANPAAVVEQAAPAPGAVPVAAPAFDLKTMIEQVAAGVNDKVFSSLRTAGVLDLAKAAKSGVTPAPAPTPNAEAPKPNAAAPVDYATAIARDRTLTRALAKLAPSDVAFDRAARAFSLENPDDPAAWATQYAADMGWASTTPASNATHPAAGSTPNGTPAAAGTPMPNTAPPARIVSQDTPLLLMSSADQEAAVARMNPYELKARLDRELREQPVRIPLRRRS